MLRQNKKPDFIGLGGGRSGTRWVCTCLYNHPDIFLPVGEPHFFSLDYNWVKGYEWYESIFADCPEDKIAGEISNSYLADPSVPEKIHKKYPMVKLMVFLRNPVDRAFSCYKNDIIAGIVKPEVDFRKALNTRSEYYIDGGRHATNLKRYFNFFSKSQILMIVYDDMLKTPLETLKIICNFLGARTELSSSFVDKIVNKGRVPKFVWLDQFFIKTSEALQKNGLTSLWWFIKKTGIADSLLALNSRADINQPKLSFNDRVMLKDIFHDEVLQLEMILGRRLELWRS